MSKRHFILGGIAGFALANIMSWSNTREITPLTKYDITGDGVVDFMVEVGQGMSPRSLNIGYVDGNEIRQVSDTGISYASKKYVTDGSIQGIVQVPLPGIKEKSPKWFTSRVFDVGPTKDGKTLELSVSDGTLDGLSFEQKINTTWANPRYGK